MAAEQMYQSKVTEVNCLFQCFSLSVRCINTQLNCVAGIMFHNQLSQLHMSPQFINQDHLCASAHLATFITQKERSREWRDTHIMYFMWKCVCTTSLWFLHSTDKKVPACAVRVIRHVILQSPLYFILNMLLKKGIGVLVNAKVIIKPMFVCLHWDDPPLCYLHACS